jgi:hypothetical protein
MSTHLLRAVAVSFFGSTLAAFIACSSSDKTTNIFPHGSGGTGAGASSGSGGGGAQPGGGSGGSTVLFDGTPGTDAPMEACATSTAKASLLPTYLQFLVDISGSMNCEPTDDPSSGCLPGDPASKWALTRAALVSAIDQMPATSSAGAILFPNATSSSSLCFSGNAAVPMAELTDAQKQLFKQVMNSTQAQGATPTEDAYLFAIQSFGSIQEESNKFVVLITDGMPTVSQGCQGDGHTAVPTAPLIADAANALGQGIKTFVIGSPGSENFRNALSQMASQGGTAPAGCSDNGPNYCHLDMTTQPDFGQAIADALNAIASKAISCVFDVPDPGDGGKLDPNLVNVIYTPGGGNPEYVGQSTESPCTGAGWHYSDDKKQIILCDETCKTAQADSAASINIEFGCATKQVR